MTSSQLPPPPPPQEIVLSDPSPATPQTANLPVEAAGSTTPEDARPTANEVYESLTGYEELAIVKMFGVPISHYAPDEDTADKGNLSMLGRALLFIVEKRNGLSDQPAYKAAMSATTTAVAGYFADDQVELDPADPDTPGGKDA